MFSTRAPLSSKTNHYSTQPSASVNNVIYATRCALIRYVTRYYLIVPVSQSRRRCWEGPCSSLFMFSSSLFSFNYPLMHDGARQKSDRCSKYSTVNLSSAVIFEYFSSLHLVKVQFSGFITVIIVIHRTIILKVDKQWTPLLWIYVTLTICSHNFFLFTLQWRKLHQLVATLGYNR